MTASSGDRTPIAVAEDICLSLPGAEKATSRGSSGYTVGGKYFCYITVNHHGDGRLALLLHAPPGAQALHTEHEPEHYFVPPYVGPKGWLGVDLGTGLPWRSVAERVLEAWRHTAPKALANKAVVAPDVAEPDAPLPPWLLQPFGRPRSAEVLDALRGLCLALPETTENEQFGSPCFKAGKRSFCVLGHRKGRLYLQIWVGAERQSMLADDPRYAVPAYIGHRGWIDLDVEDHLPRAEAAALVLGSYRHFALQRMLKALPEDADSAWAAATV